eukprot:Gb_21071 [translate_table: standard]
MGLVHKDILGSVVVGIAQASLANGVLVVAPVDGVMEWLLLLLHGWCDGVLRWMVLTGQSIPGAPSFVTFGGGRQSRVGDGTHHNGQVGPKLSTMAQNKCRNEYTPTGRGGSSRRRLEGETRLDKMDCYTERTTVLFLDRWILRRTRNDTTKARKRIPWRAPPRIAGGSEPAPPPLPKSLSSFLTDEVIVQMDKISLRRALIALNLPTSGKIETLRERLKEAQENTKE